MGARGAGDWEKPTEREVPTVLKIPSSKGTHWVEDAALCGSSSLLPTGRGEAGVGTFRKTWIMSAEPRHPNKSVPHQPCPRLHWTWADPHAPQALTRAWQLCPQVLGEGNQEHPFWFNIGRRSRQDWPNPREVTWDSVTATKTNLKKQKEEERKETNLSKRTRHSGDKSRFPANCWGMQQIITNTAANYKYGIVTLKVLSVEMVKK